jgi:endonuclease/exonuclease/phosphatase family metal-dependent hydrolase
MAKIPPPDLPVLALPGGRQLCVLNMNIAGSDPKWGKGANGPITAYLADTVGPSVDIITLQEVCSGQHSAIREALGSKWSDTFKNFGQVEGCNGAKFGLSIFTKGPHSDPTWRYLWSSPLGSLDKTQETHPDTHNTGAWGLLKVRFKGVDVYTVHIRSLHRRKQIPEVRDLLIQPGTGKAIVTGDFNETPDNGRMGPFYDAWVECDGFRQPTLGAKKVDYIWTTWKPFQMFGGPIDTVRSNHKLVWALIRWK